MDCALLSHLILYLDHVSQGFLLCYLLIVHSPRVYMQVISISSEFFFLIYVFTYICFWLCCVFIAVCGLLSVAGEGYSNCSAWASHCGDLSRCGAWAPGYAGFSSWGMWAQQLQLPGSSMDTHTARTQVKLVLMYSVVSNSPAARGLEPSRLLRPWEFPGRNTGVDGHFLLQGIFLTRGWNLRLPCLLHGRWIRHSSVVVAHGLISLFFFQCTYYCEACFSQTACRFL